MSDAEMLDWLLKQIGDDETIAERARSEADADGHWHAHYWHYEGSHLAEGRSCADRDCRPDYYYWHSLVNLYDPARVMAEVEWKRAIVRQYQRAMQSVESEDRRVAAGGYGDARGDVGAWGVLHLRPVVLSMVALYADREGYQAEWVKR